MSKYLGNYISGGLVEDKFFTRDLNQVGSTIVNGTVVVFNGAGTVGTNAGVTFSKDIGGVTGAHYFSVDTTTYTAGSNYQAGFSDGTIGGTVVTGQTFRSWGLENRYSDVQAISGDKTAADNMELQYDTTGLTGDTFPATQAQLGNITNTGAAVNKPASSYVLTTGVQASGTVATTETLDQVYHQHTDTAGAMELYYEFNVGAGKPTSVTMTGRLNSGNDSLDIFGYDWVSASFKQIGVLAGKAQSTDDVQSYTVFVNMVGNGSDLGKVRIQFKASSGLTSANLYVDQIFLSYSEAQSGYEGGAVWFDSNASNTGVVVGLDGVSGNPVSSEASVTTLLASTGLHKIEVTPNSTFTLEAAHDNQVMIGEDWTLAFNGKSISNTHIQGAVMSGTFTAASKPSFDRCDLFEVNGQSVSIRDSAFCGTVNGFVMGTTGKFTFDNCYSGVPGTNAPVITWPGLGASELGIRHYSGGMKYVSMGTSDVSTLEGIGKFTEVSSTGGALELRGVFGTAGITNITVNQDNNMNTKNIGSMVMSAGNIDGYTLEQASRLDLAASVGTSTGAASTSMTYSAADKSKTRITMTVDADGERTNSTLDAD